MKNANKIQLFGRKTQTQIDFKLSKKYNEKENVLKGKICLKELPLEEKAILEVIIANPEITQKEIASKIGKSERTVRNKITNLKEKGILERVNGKKNGKWEVRPYKGVTKHAYKSNINILQ